MCNFLGRDHAFKNSHSGKVWLFDVICYELNTANSNERVRYNNVLLGSVKGLVGITVVETGVKTEEYAGKYGGPDTEVGSMT